MWFWSSRPTTWVSNKGCPAHVLCPSDDIELWHELSKSCYWVKIMLTWMSSFPLSSVASASFDMFDLIQHINHWGFFSIVFWDIFFLAKKNPSATSYQPPVQPVTHRKDLPAWGIKSFLISAISIRPAGLSWQWVLGNIQALVISTTCTSGPTGLSGYMGGIGLVFSATTIIDQLSFPSYPWLGNISLGNFSYKHRSSWAFLLWTLGNIKPGNSSYKHQTS